VQPDVDAGNGWVGLFIVVRLLILDFKLLKKQRLIDREISIIRDRSFEICSIVASHPPIHERCRKDPPSIFCVWVWEGVCVCVLCVCCVGVFVCVFVWCVYAAGGLHTTRPQQ
jgi:hypothetical protein